MYAAFISTQAILGENKFLDLCAFAIIKTNKWIYFAHLLNNATLIIGVLRSMAA